MDTINKPVSQLDLDLKLINSWSEVIGTHIISRLTHEQVAHLCKLCDYTTLQLAERLLPMAAQFAVTPISGFQVGAIVIDEHDQIFLGANYEKLQQPLSQTLHAEQSAIFNALNHAAAPLRYLVVTAAPCGHCRQFIRELPESFNIEVWFDDQQFDFEQLLPHSFGPEQLGITTNLCSQHSDGKNITQLAKFSYSPYSHCQIALMAKQAETILATSWYVENAAFNPSASPLTLLLSQLQLNGHNLSQVETIEVSSNQSMIDFQSDLTHFATLHPQIKFI